MEAPRKQHSFSSPPPPPHSVYVNAAADLEAQQAYGAASQKLDQLGAAVAASDGAPPELQSAAGAHLHDIVSAFGTSLSCAAGYAWATCGIAV